MLICAFVGKEKAFALYNHAIAKQYRFYSYGDSSLLIT
jgi:S-adenosylmethionine:tRNA ribosyltransferase-isomerase